MTDMTVAELRNAYRLISKLINTYAGMDSMSEAREQLEVTLRIIDLELEIAGGSLRIQGD